MFNVVVGNNSFYLKQYYKYIYINKKLPMELWEIMQIKGFCLKSSTLIYKPFGKNLI